MNFFETLKEKEKMVEATDYIDWIYEFTKKHNCISDDPWDEYDGATETDKENIKNLSLFFSVIEEYIQRTKNNEAAVCEGETFITVSYYFKHKDKTFCISTIIGQGAVTSVKISQHNEKYHLYKKVMVLDSSDFIQSTKKSST